MRPFAGPAFVAFRPRPRCDGLADSTAPHAFPMARSRTRPTGGRLRSAWREGAVRIEDFGMGECGCAAGHEKLTERLGARQQVQASRHGSGSSGGTLQRRLHGFSAGWRLAVLLLLACGACGLSSRRSSCCAEVFAAGWVAWLAQSRAGLNFVTW